MEKIVKIISITHVTHDVLWIVAEKPAILHFEPGQAVDVSINKPGWEKELRPFTFTSLPQNEHVEFTIKTYPSHHGLTEQMLSLAEGDELIIHDVFGDILYKGEGIFIAGGAGVTPFISIFKELEDENKVGNNKLIFANKTEKDIILKDKFEILLGKNFINVLSAESVEGYEYGHISADLIKKYMDKQTSYFYLCGPEPMLKEIENQLHSIGVSDDAIVKEGY